MHLEYLIDAPFIDGDGSSTPTSVVSISEKRVQPQEGPSKPARKDNRGLQLHKAVPFIPYIILLIFCLVCSGGSKLIADVELFQADSRIPEANERCLHQEKRFGTHLFYVISLMSTIGFGTLRPCSIGLKLFSIFTSAIGLPLFVYVLVDAGDRLATWCHSMHVKRRAAATRQINWTLTPLLLQNGSRGVDPGDFMLPVAEVGRKEGIEDEELKSWFGLLALSVIYLLIAIYYVMAENYTTLDALYYSLMIFLAGDFTMDNYGFATPVYVLVIAGFAMVSMTINIIMANMQRLVKRIQKSVKRQLAEAEATGAPLPCMEDLMAKALEDAGASGMTAKLMTSSKLDEVSSQCKKRLEQAATLREIKADAAARLAAAQRPAVQRQPASCQAAPATSEKSVLAARKTGSSESGVQTITDVQSAHAQSESHPTVAMGTSTSSGAETSIGCQAGGIMAEAEVQAVAETRAVEMQHPPDRNTRPDWSSVGRKASKARIAR